MRCPLRCSFGVLVIAAACARAAVAPSSPTPAAARSSSTAPCCGGDPHAVAARYRVPAITTRRFSPDALWAALDPVVRAPSAGASLRVREVGRSVQGRPIRAVTFGRGATRVMLWSQMHGDEATATMGLVDILAWLADPAAAGDPLRRRLDSALTVVMVPMLNPDGAVLFQRENAIGVDVNRDARRLATPEARTLKALYDSVRPAYGFNLHDQNARTLAGPRGPQVAIALLAPAAEPTNAWGPIRSDARLVAATVASLLGTLPGGELAGRVAKYNDAHEPRAFGDLMQQWGTRTVLIESGALPNDPEKQRLRAVNVVAILGALNAIATGEYRRADVAAYESLPTNARAALDVWVRGGTLVLPGAPPMRADLTLAYEEPVARLRPRVREVGDLLNTVAIDTVDATGLFIHADPSSLTTQGSARWLRIDGEARLTIRRGPEPTSAVVRAIGGAAP